MDVVVTTPPTVEPLSIAEALDFLKAEDAGDDALIATLIVAARQHAQMFTRRAFITQTLTGTLGRFPYIPLHLQGYIQELQREYRLHHRTIVVPRPPLQSVTSIQYYDVNNALQTLDPSQYLVLTQKLPARIALADVENDIWPITYPRPDAVKIVYIAGYGADETFVPESLKLALKFLVKHWYDRRDLVPSDGNTAELPFACRALLSEHLVESFV